MSVRITRSQLLAAVVLVGLSLLVTWIARNTYWREVRAPLQLRGPAAIDPFYGAERLAQLLGARTQWRHDTLQLPPLDGVIFAGSWSFASVPGRAEVLERWVGAGGRLVLDSRLIEGRDDLESWTGLTRAQLPDSEVRERAAFLPCEQGFTAAPAGETPRHYTLCHLSPYMQLKTRATPTWTLRDARGHLQGARVAIGSGSVTVLDGYPFGTEDLASDSPDHAQLLVDALQLSRGDTVFFLSDAQGPTLLGLMWRTGWPVILLATLLLALALWRAMPRFGPLEAPPDTARRSLAEQIRGTGQFTLRHGGGRALLVATARAVHDTAGRRIRGYAAMSPSDRAAALASLTGLAEQALARALRPDGAPGRRDLYSRLLILESARRLLQR
jgi:hypothetical protein